jgi:hypothetical protein
MVALLRFDLSHSETCVLACNVIITKIQIREGFQGAFSILHVYVYVSGERDVAWNACMQFESALVADLQLQGAGLIINKGVICR